MNKPSVCISILTYNNFLDTAECLESIKNLQYDSHTTIVIDNGSTDDSIMRLRTAYPNQEIVSLPTNVGVPAGFNEGVLWALKHGYKYVFLLNNDTLLAPDMLSEILTFQTNQVNCGMVMPKVLFYPEREETTHRRAVWSDGGYYRKFPPGFIQKDNRKNIDFEHPRKIEFAPACGILVPISTFEEVGLFDPGYFFFFEDWDFSIRTRKAGLDIWCVPNAILWHKVSKSTKKNDALYWYTLGESMLRFYRRHYPVLSSFFQVSYRILRDLFLNGMLKHWKPYFRGIFSGLQSELGDYPEIAEKLSLHNGKATE